MAGDKLMGTDLVDQSAHAEFKQLTKEADDLLNKFVEMAGGAKAFRDAISNAQGITDTSNAIKNNRVQLTEYEKMQKQVIETNQRLVNSETKLAQALALKRVQLAESNAENKLAAQQVKAAEGSYVQLDIQLKRLILDYKALSQADRDAAKGTDLLARLYATNTQLKALDATMGNHQRNVGNYASGWSAIGNSINQLSRELPAFAVSMNTGFFAISNNIPALFDAISGIIKKNAALVKDGKPTVSALKQVAEALFSWNSLLSVGVTLLTVYGGKLIEWIVGTEKATKSVEELTKAKQASEEAGSKEIVQLQKLYSTATDINLSLSVRKKAVDDLQELYPHYFENLKDESILAGNAASAYDDLSNAILRKTIFNGLMAQADETSKPLAGLLIQLDRVNEKIDRLKGPKGATSKQGYFISGQQSNADKGYLQELESQAAGLRKQIAPIQAEINGIISVAKKYDVSDVFAKEKDKNKKENKPAKDKEDSISAIKRQYETEKALLETSLNDEKITETAYYDSMIELAREYRGDRSGLTKKEKQDEIKFNEELSKSEKENYDKILEWLDAETKKVAEVDEAKLKSNLEGAKKVHEKNVEYQKMELNAIKEGIAGNEALEAAADEESKKIHDKKMARLEMYAQAAQAAFSLIGNISGILYDKELKKIDSVDRAQQNQYDEDVNRVNQSFTNQIDRDKELARLEAARTAQKKKNETDRITADIKRAKQQKAIDILNITTSTALAVIKAYTEGDPYTKIARSLIAAGVGAGQLAIAAAAPLPQYGEGTENHPGGFAIVGDKGMELVQEPSGKSYLTPTTSTIIDLPRNSKVIPHDELMKMVYNTAYVKLANGNQSVSSDTMAIAILSSFNELSTKVDKMSTILEQKKLAVSFASDAGSNLFIQENKF